MTSLYVWRRLRAAYLRLSPISPSWLPVRCWRRLWLAATVRLLVALPLCLVTLIPYLLALGFVALIGWAGDRFEHLYVWAANTDRERSGWKPPDRRAPAPKLSPDWARRHPLDG